MPAKDKARLAARMKAYNARPEQKKMRAARNKARRAAIAAGKAAKGDGKDIHHKKPLSKGGSKSLSNTTVASRKKNRGHGMSNGSNQYEKKP